MVYTESEYSTLVYCSNAYKEHELNVILFSLTLLLITSSIRQIKSLFAKNQSYNHVFSFTAKYLGSTSNVPFGQISAVAVEAVKMTALSSWNLKAYFLSSLYITMDENTLQIIDSRTKKLMKKVELTSILDIQVGVSDTTLIMTLRNSDDQTIHIEAYKTNKAKVKQLCALFKIYNCNMKPKPPCIPASPEKSGVFNPWKVQEIIQSNLDMMSLKPLKEDEINASKAFIDHAPSICRSQLLEKVDEEDFWSNICGEIETIRSEEVFTSTHNTIPSVQQCIVSDELPNVPSSPVLKSISYQLLREEAVVSNTTCPIMPDALTTEMESGQHQRTQCLSTNSDVVTELPLSQIMAYSLSPLPIATVNEAIPVNNIHDMPKNLCSQLPQVQSYEPSFMTIPLESTIPAQNQSRSQVYNNPSQLYWNETLNSHVIQEQQQEPQVHINHHYHQPMPVTTSTINSETNHSQFGLFFLENTVVHENEEVVVMEGITILPP